MYSDGGGCADARFNKSVDVPPKKESLKRFGDIQSSKQKDTRQRNLDPFGDLELPYHRKWYNQEHDIKDHIRDPRSQCRRSNVLAFRIPNAFVPNGL